MVDKTIREACVFDTIAQVERMRKMQLIKDNLLWKPALTETAQKIGLPISTTNDLVKRFLDKYEVVITLKEKENDKEEE